ncbi:MAG: NUDIX hydrolase [Patescibacteria group bacterium]|jgi:ADP-ribose pyrophosphatase
MPLKKWEKVSDELLARNPYWEYRLSRHLLSSGKEVKYYYAHDAGGSMIVGVNAEGKIAMVNQFRPVIDKESLEFPAGGKQSGKTEEETASAEFAEETQFSAKHVDRAGFFEASSGLTDQVASVFVAYDLSPCSIAKDETEDFELFWFTPAEIDQMIAEGRITNGWSLATWTIAKKKALEIIAEQKQG